MPLYDYNCQSCDLVFEVSRGINEEAIDAPCPSCGSLHTNQVFLPSTRCNGFVFKGEGFYETEHGKQKHNK